MPDYRRVRVPGGTYFFTVVAFERRPLFADSAARDHLRTAFTRVKEQMPFEDLAAVLIPDHLHCIWKLPPGDSDYSRRWGLVKATFTKLWSREATPPAAGSVSRQRHRERDVRQRRFWEHTVRDKTDFARHLDYIHFNPVKHGLVRCAHAWPHSTFRQWVSNGWYREDWCCACDGRAVNGPDFTELSGEYLE